MPEYIRNNVKIFGEQSNGTEKAVLVGSDGQILNSAYFDSVIIEAPGVNDQYDTITSTINNGLTDQAVTFTNVTTAYSVQVINKTSNTTLVVKLNGVSSPSINVTNDATRLGKVLSNIKTTTIHLSNTSGSNIDYEIVILGV